MECMDTFSREYFGDKWMARVFDIATGITLFFAPWSEAEKYAEQGYGAEREAHIRTALNKPRRK